jgi:hypothetical protein
MRFLAALVVLSFGVSPVIADGKRTAQPRAKRTTATAAPAPCKRVVVGRGLDRKVVCEFTAPVVVKTGAPTPKVMIVPRDGRNVVGRPRSEDRLHGLSPRL